MSTNVFRLLLCLQDRGANGLAFEMESEIDPP
jgi:hypothetical protein